MPRQAYLPRRALELAFESKCVRSTDLRDDQKITLAVAAAVLTRCEKRGWIIKLEGLLDCRGKEIARGVKFDPFAYQLTAEGEAEVRGEVDREPDFGPLLAAMGMGI